MNTDLILAAARGSINGALSFPESVAKLLEAQVEYYQVDYSALSIRYYDGQGAVVGVPLTLAGLAAPASELDVEKLRSAIVDSQSKGQKYPAFCERAVAAGVQSYFAFLRGRRVTYLGRTGDAHVEWFPGAAPKP